MTFFKIKDLNKGLKALAESKKSYERIESEIVLMQRMEEMDEGEEKEAAKQELDNMRTEKERDQLGRTVEKLKSYLPGRRQAYRKKKEICN